MSLLVKIVLSLVVTFIAFGFVIFLAGGGHGTYLPMKYLFPYSMIIAILNKNINWLAISIGLLQFPIYSLIIDNKLKWKILVLVLHIFAIIIVLNMNDQIFN
ncbi:hypothetical protein [Winogradskyella poriferorum]|uniref:Uncharacterized protein n=1 Tax=Winogradskyella poriferorum TaxID=307627 RepID=A0ABU7W6R9_9FLAO